MNNATTWTPIMAITPAISAVLAVFLKQIVDLINNKSKDKKIKALLFIEVEENKKHINEVITSLEFLSEIEINTMSEENLERYISDPKFKLNFEKLILNGERHLNQLSDIVYKDIFLKSSERYRKGKDDTIHRIYFNVIKISKNKSFINSLKIEEMTKQKLELYFKIYVLAKKVLDDSNQLLKT